MAFRNFRHSFMGLCSWDFGFAAELPSALSRAVALSLSFVRWHSTRPSPARKNNRRPWLGHPLLLQVQSGADAMSDPRSAVPVIRVITTVFVRPRWAGLCCLLTRV